MPGAATFDSSSSVCFVEMVRLAIDFIIIGFLIILFFFFYHFFKYYNIQITHRGSPALQCCYLLPVYTIIKAHGPIRVQRESLMRFFFIFSFFFILNALSIISNFLSSSSYIKVIRFSRLCNVFLIVFQITAKNFLFSFSLTRPFYKIPFDLPSN